MITAPAILYAIGAVFTQQYLFALVRDIPEDELERWHIQLAALVITALCIFWPVFWAWLILDMWRE